jgi:hypothetical protein
LGILPAELHLCVGIGDCADFHIVIELFIFELFEFFIFEFFFVELEQLQ